MDTVRDKLRPMQTGSRVTGLDLLRFIAAVSVMAYHLLTPWPDIRGITRFGWLGVPLFFMISGYVILWTAQTKTVLQFIGSRVARLYPSFWIAVLITAAIVQAPWRTIFANLTMIPTPLGVERLDGVYWTLEVEIVFYALICVVIATRQMKRIEIVLLGWLAVCAVDRFIALPEAITLKRFAPFFVAGCFYFHARTHGFTLWRSAAILLSLVLCIVAAMGHQVNFMAVPAPLITAATVCSFFALFFVFQRIALPRAELWGWLGSLTYPLYLTHNVIGKSIIESLPFGIGTNTTIAIVLVIVLSAAMASLVERRACPALQRAILRHAMKPVT